MLKRIGLIGFGAIGQSIATHLQAGSAGNARIAAVCLRPEQAAGAARLAASGVTVTESVDELLECELDLIVEAAGQGAVVEHAEKVLRAGLDLYVLSVGALADPGLRARLTSAAFAGRGGICIPAGALAGFDGLLSLRKSGLHSVVYTSTKPPTAWRGTPAENSCALEELDRRTVFFRGNAAEAALTYPKNANLAAAVALAGIGFEQTRVELVADPQAVGNTGTLVARGENATLELTLASTSFEENPKTSAITGSSVLAAIENRGACFRFV